MTHTMAAHTEDDTFNKLRRIPFEEMSDILSTKAKTYTSATEYAKIRPAILEAHGWDIKDYVQANTQYLRKILDELM